MLSSFCLAFCMLNIDDYIGQGLLQENIQCLVHVEWPTHVRHGRAKVDSVEIEHSSITTLEHFGWRLLKLLADHQGGGIWTNHPKSSQTCKHFRHLRTHASYISRLLNKYRCCITISGAKMHPSSHHWWQQTSAGLLHALLNACEAQTKSGEHGH